MTHRSIPAYCRRLCVSAGAALLLTGALPAGAAGLLDNIKSQASQMAAGNASQSSSSSSSSGDGLGALMGSGSSSALGSLGGLGLPAMGGNTVGNAAGVLQYCVKNNYLNAANAQNVKDKLLGKIGLGNATASKDQGYQQGALGMLQGSDGSSFDMTRLKSQLKEKACDYVLDNAKSFL